VTVSPLDHAELRLRVSAAIDEFLAAQRSRLTVISRDLLPMVDTLEAFVAGGKRLRPAFAYWGWRGAGGEDSAEIVRAVTALEWVQACALIHDDVMDGSDTRRGQPAVHRRFEAVHRGYGWSGGADLFGVGVAILLGDTSLVWSDEMLGNSGMPHDAVRRARSVFDEMRTELMAGQYLDILTQARADTSVGRAMTVVRYKSAKYTIERPLHFGAALAGGSPELIAAYSAYGLPLGEAFQLRDDILGVFGDPAETGKPAGDDIREGKRTVLIAKTMERATEKEAALVERHLGNADLGPRGVAAVREVITCTGALAETEKLIGELTERAMVALHDDRIDPAAADVLRELAVAATARKV
jgi:geranylgeranyl diphosphate synthase type I